MRASICWFLVNCLVAASGCNQPGVSISGKVTLDGAPLDDGTISLVPVPDGPQTAGWATITKGQFSIPAESGLVPGKYRVEIRALRAGGKANANDPTLVETQEAVPGQYNTRSQLMANVKPGANIADFHLKSK